MTKARKNLKTKLFLKKSMISLFILLVSWPAFSFQQEKILEKKKPNVLFIFADDQRSGTIHALGNKEIFTPNLDKLVKEGLNFNNTYNMGGSSAAVCAPSRAMLLTGRHLYGIEKKGWESPILEETETMPETFKKAGYATFGTGKQHNGKKVFARGYTDGSEIFFGGMADPWNVPVFHFDNAGKYDKTIPYIKEPKINNKIEYHKNRDHLTQGKHASELFADATIDFLKKHNYNKPFFAYLSFTAPHDPRSMPKEYEQMYDTTAIAMPPNFLPLHPWDFGDFYVRDEKLAPHPRTESDVKTHTRDYYAMITHMDAQIGRILEQLKASGAYENTIIIFTSDNGAAIGQHGLFGKQNLYEHSIGVPLVISGPGIPKNEKREAFTYLYDIFPTLCELTGLESPNTIQGKSFATSLKNVNYKTRKSMTFGYKENIRAYRNEQFKLIEYFVNGERNSQLFNLEKDPFEIINLLDDKKNTSKYLEMKTKMLQEMKSQEDTNQIYNQLFKETTK